VRTTVDINDALLRDLRECAAREGRPFRQVLEQTIAMGLARRQKPRAARRFRVKPHRLGLRPGFQAVSLNQLYDQFEAEQTSHRP